MKNWDTLGEFFFWEGLPYWYPHDSGPIQWAHGNFAGGGDSFGGVGG